MRQADIGWVVFGLLVGGLVAVLALVMTGGGHGWNSGILSALSCFAAPLAGLAWSRRRTFGFWISLGVLLLAILLDVVLVLSTPAAGTEYVGRVWDASRGLFITWAVLFASWQLLAVGTIILRLRNRESV